MTAILHRSPYILPGILVPSISEEMKNDITPTMIVNIVSDYFGIMKVSLTYKARNQRLVYPRMIAMYLVRENTSLTLKEVVELFSPAIINHTSVIHAVATIKDQLDARLATNTKTKQDITNITRIIFNYIEAISNN